MAILTNLFGESPFGALEAHGRKVHEAVRLLRDVFAAWSAGDRSTLRQLADRIAELESEADEIRNHLHETLVSIALLPMSKEHFFNILEQQDSLADRAEDVAGTLTYRAMALPEPLAAAVRDYLETILKNCELAAGIMSKLGLLVESSFGGRDALTLSRLITELARRDDAVKQARIDLTRKLLADADRLPPIETVLWLRILSHLAGLSKFADRTGHGVRMTLRIKP